jgi:predicted transcriptional regulator of viral defense system
MRTMMPLAKASKNETKVMEHAHEHGSVSLKDLEDMHIGVGQDNRLSMLGRLVMFGWLQRIPSSNDLTITEAVKLHFLTNNGSR